jgi:hypothetical protein
MTYSILKQIVSLTLLIIALSNTSSALAASRRDDFSDEEVKRIQTRVYLKPQCLISEEGEDPKLVGTIAAIVVPVLIERAIGAFSGVLRKAGEKEELKESGKEPILMYTVSHRDKSKPRDIRLKSSIAKGCVIIVRGTFHPKATENPCADKSPNAKDVDSDTRTALPRLLRFCDQGPLLLPDHEEMRIRRLNDNGIPVAKIALIYEASIETSFDKAATRYESRYLQVNRFLGNRSQKKSRNVVINIALNDVGPREDAVRSMVMINFGEVAREERSEPIILDRKALEGKKSGWVTGPALTQNQFEKLQSLEVSETAEVFPVTLVGTVIETEDGIQALKFIADVLDATKTDIAKTSSTEIFKDREAERRTEANELEATYLAEEQAYSNYLTAQLELSRAKEAKRIVDSDIDSSNEAKETAAHQVRIKEFAVTTAIRIWCGKLTELRNVGKTPSPERPLDPCK